MAQAFHDGKNLYVLSDQQTPEKFAGGKVRVKGVLYEKTRIIKVDSIEPAGLQARRAGDFNPQHRLKPVRGLKPALH